MALPFSALSFTNSEFVGALEKEEVNDTSDYSILSKIPAVHEMSELTRSGSDDHTLVSLSSFASDSASNGSNKHSTNSSNSSLSTDGDNFVGRFLLDLVCSFVTYPNASCSSWFFNFCDVFTYWSLVYLGFIDGLFSWI